MKITALKILLILIAVTLVILAILPFYINPIAQRIVEQNVYPIFENRLKIGSVNISLFRWIVELKNVELLQPDGFGKGNLLKAASLQSNFEILPFFRNHLPFKNIIIIKPEFTVIMTRDEKINTDYIFSSKADSPGGGDSEKATVTSSVLPTKESSAPAVPDNSSKSFTLQIDDLVIKDGTFTIYNYKTRSQEPPTIVLTELHIEIEDVAVPNTKDVKTTFTITASLTSSQHKAPLKCSGEGTLEKQLEDRMVHLARELEEANARLAELAVTDSLTNLFNRRAFDEQLDRQIQLMGRIDRTLSLLMLDIDYFKQYNDRYGHPAGDEVLKIVASLLRQNARATDVVARYGGEEFVIIMPDTNETGALQMAERFQKAIRVYPWQQAGLTVSMGISTLLLGKEAARKTVNYGMKLLVETDQALYLSKQKGRNRVTYYSEM